MAKTRPHLNPNASLTERLNFIKEVANPEIYNNIKKTKILNSGKYFASNPRTITINKNDDTVTYSPGFLETIIPWWTITHGKYPGICIGLPYGHPDYGKDEAEIATSFHYRVSANPPKKCSAIENMPFLEEYKDLYKRYWVIQWDYSDTNRFFTMDSDWSKIDNYTTIWTYDSLDSSARSATASASCYIDSHNWERIAKYYNPETKLVITPIDIEEAIIKATPDTTVEPYSDTTVEPYSPIAIAPVSNTDVPF